VTLWRAASHLHLDGAEVVGALHGEHLQLRPAGAEVGYEVRRRAGDELRGRDPLLANRPVEPRPAERREFQRQSPNQFSPCRLRSTSASSGCNGDVTAAICQTNDGRRETLRIRAHRGRSAPASGPSGWRTGAGRVGGPLGLVSPIFNLTAERRESEHAGARSPLPRLGSHGESGTTRRYRGGSTGRSDR
jgi:hypothetical protein